MVFQVLSYFRDDRGLEPERPKSFGRPGSWVRERRRSRLSDWIPKVREFKSSEVQKLWIFPWAVHSPYGVLSFVNFSYSSYTPLKGGGAKSS